MIPAEPAAALREVAGPLDEAGLAAIRASGLPVVIRGEAAHWPAVAAARRGDEAIVAYLNSWPARRPLRAIAAPPSAQGRFFYNDDLTGFNFHAANGRLELFLADLLRAREVSPAPAMAVQSEEIADLLPHVAAENRLAVLPGVRPRIWIGNRIRVAPHYDVKENLAVCVAGRRRFTLFPPDQIANLYPGPLELTPAGTPVSMVDHAGPRPGTLPALCEGVGGGTAGHARSGRRTLHPLLLVARGRIARSGQHPRQFLVERGHSRWCRSAL
ncbi:MAG: cupin-like domain-containing protein [Altererythrobacter sp.]|nr:cupin-like domain-containing protein [Altererythrobacter sp.]